MAQIPLVQDRTPLNEVKYVGKDFQSIFDALLRRLKIQYGDVYNDFATSAEGIMLVDLCAYAAGLIVWAMDRTVNDCYLTTVRTTERATHLTRQLGYKMTPAAASSADLTLTFTNGIPGPCTMSAGWRFQGPSGIQFESIADLNLDAQAPGYSTTIAVAQGETQFLNFVGDGTVFQQYRLYFAGLGEDQVIADRSVRVWVDGAEWTENTFINYEATNQFEVDYHADPVLLRFGDGLAGNVPPDGSNIRVQFTKCVGATGNVKAHTIITSLDVLLVAGAVVLFTVDHDLGARSGRNAEDIEHAKRYAPITFAARDGAVTRMDYEALSNSFVDPLYGAVAKAYAHTPRDRYSDPIFIGYFNVITQAVADFITAFDADHASVIADLATLNNQVTILSDEASLMEAVRSNLLSAVASILAGAAQVKGSLLANDGNFTTIATAHSTAVTELDIIDAYINAHIVDPDKTNLLSYTAIVRSQLTIATTGTTAARNGDAAAVALIGAMIETPAATMTPKLQSSSEDNLQDSLLAQQAALTAVVVPLADIPSQLADIENAADVMQSTEVIPTLTLIADRIGDLFDSSCRSNVVQVPILSVDADGNYVPPPSGLMVALQAYLDQYKETTQYVDVIDGSIGLVNADITIQYKVQNGFVSAEVRSAIDTTVRGLLRGRDYDDPLYLSDVYRYVRACSDGIAYVTITLAGAALDGHGNLVPQPTQVLILGALTLVEI